MRKYKQVHRKEVAFDLKEWAEVERRAAAAKVKTGTYIKKIAVNGEFNYYDIEAAAIHVFYELYDVCAGRLSGNEICF